MSTLRVLSLYAILFIGLVQCTSAQNQKVEDLSIQEFKALVDKTPTKIVLDVRTDGEVAQGIIPGAIQADFLGDAFQQKVATLDKNKPVFVYCAVGGRSSKAAKQLYDMGFMKVYNAMGGMNAWKAANYPIVKK
jgi:rhodanese-related sulfurtransferase